MDRNREVKVSMWKDDDSERAEIKIKSIGIVSELRFDQKKLNAVSKFTSADLLRIIESIKEAEEKRIDPNKEIISSFNVILDQLNYLKEDKSELYINMELEMPIASCGAIELKPKFPESEQGEDW